MEQKGLDEINESFLGEEILEEEVQNKPQEVVEEVLEEIKKEPTIKVVGKEKKATIQKKSAKVGNSEKEDIPKIEKIIVEPVSGKIEKKKEEIKIESVGTSKPAVKKVERPKNEGGLFKEISTWKALTGFLVILLAFSIFTGGFVVTGSTTAELEEITLNDAEIQALAYVNSQLLQPPFVAEIVDSEDNGNLYKISLSVAGQLVETYVTKDGSLFFPQGFMLNEVIGATTENQELEAPTIEVSIDDDPIKGDQNAQITIIEFSDYECPFCAKFNQEVLPTILERYVDTGKARLVFRDFPLSFHKEAKPAAMASECADDQGKFWEYHDLLFANQEFLGIESYLKWAQELDLNIEEFTFCLETNKHSEEVDMDLAEAQSYGVMGTPAFFVNGVLISGAQPLEVFIAEIENALSTIPVEEVNEEEQAPEVEMEAPEPIIEEEIVNEEFEEVVQETVESETVEFNLAAKRWLFSPREISVELGDTVILTIEPENLDFTFSIPELNVNEEISSITVVEFVADTTGTFDFECSSCDDWRGMVGSLIVE